MTTELQASETNPQKQATAMWRWMAVGPVLFFLWLFTIALLLALESWGLVPDPFSAIDPEKDVSIGVMVLLDLFLGFGPFVVLALAEIAVVVVAYRRRAALADTPFESHAVSAIRTFWIMVAGVAVTICLALTLLMIPNINAIGFGVGTIFIMAGTIPLLFIFKAWRVYRGLRRAKAGLPIADRPTRWS